MSIDAKLLSDELYTALYKKLEARVVHRGCCHTLRRTRALLQKHDIDVRANITKIIDLGGHCDCEVLMNVTPKMWRKMRHEPLHNPIIMGESESDEFVSHLMLQSVQHTLFSSVD